MGKDSFLIYTAFYKPISILSDKQLGRLFRAIFAHNLGEAVSVEDDIRMAFEFFKNQFDIDESKLKTRPSGSMHWNWKGGITNENHRLRESSKYHHWRKDVFARDNYTCQKCGQIGGVLNAHHIKAFSIYPEFMFDVDNGITLCKKCHMEIHKIEREWQKK